MKFDPTSRFRMLRESGISIFMQMSGKDALRTNSNGLMGDAILGVAVECYIVGLFADAARLLKKANRMLATSVERNEHERPGRPAVFAEFAIAQWLIKSVDDGEMLSRQVDHDERRFVIDRTRPDKLDVQLSLAPYLEAERYERLVARYESTGLKRPTNLRRIQSQGTMCYVMARHRLGMEYTNEEISTALETFLKRSVKEWLGRYGAFSTAARWMKIAHWKPGDDPIATLLRCYDYLPGLKPPKYPPEKAK